MKQKLVKIVTFVSVLFVIFTVFRVLTNSIARKNCQEAYELALNNSDQPVDYHFSSGLWACKCRVN